MRRHVLSTPSYLGAYVAAGSGITPISSILKTTLETERESSFTLIYGNQSTDTIMFLEEIEGIKNRYPDRYRIFTVLSREIQSAVLLNGRIKSEIMKRFLEALLPANDIDHVFLCGSFQLVTAAQDDFINAVTKKTNVHTELFGTPENLAAMSSKPAVPLNEEEANQTK